MIEIKLPDQCSVCLQSLARESSVMRVETSMPGMQYDGDPSRIVGWHLECAPAWAKENEDGE